MHLSKPFKMLVAIFTSITFLATSLGVSPGAFAAPATPEVSLPYQAIIDRDLRLAIPQELGKLEYFNPGAGNQPAIFHIQTAHGHYEAQQQIRQILHYLEKQYGVTTLLVEGSAFQLDPKLLNFFPNDPALTQKVNDELTKRALVKGPELYLLDKLHQALRLGTGSSGLDKTKSQNDARVPSDESRADVTAAYGIENLESYRENGMVFVEVLQQKEKTAQFLSEMDGQIDRLASRMLNKDLRDFLRRVDSFEKNRIPLDLWLKDLKDEAQKNLEIDLASPAEQLDWPMMVRFFKMQELAAKLDLQKFSQEREGFLKAVKRFLPVLLYGEIERFLMSDQMSRQLPDPETELLFEDMVKQLPENFNYDAFPNLRVFIGTLLLQSELKADRLFAETKALLIAISGKLIRNQGEKQLVALLADHRLLQKLFALQLMPEDYELIVGGRRAEGGGSLKPSDFVKRFESAILHPPSSIRRGRDVQFSHLAEFDALYEKAMKFYAGVKERDDAMEQRIEERLRETGVNKVAVITGGFHSRPFADHFSSKNCTYALISPQLTSADNAGHAAYEQNALRFAPRATHQVPRELEEGSSWSVERGAWNVKGATRESEFLSDPGLRTGDYAINAGAMRAEIRKVIQEVAGREALQMRGDQTQDFSRLLDEPRLMLKAGPKTGASSEAVRSETRAAGRWVPRMVVITTLAAVMGLTACAVPRGQQPSSVPTPGITPAEIRKSLEVRPPVKPQDIKPPVFSAPRPSMPSAPSMPKIPSVHRRSEIRNMPPPKTVPDIFRWAKAGDREALDLLAQIARDYGGSIDHSMKSFFVTLTTSNYQDVRKLADEAWEALQNPDNNARVSMDFLATVETIFGARSVRGFWNLTDRVKADPGKFVRDTAVYGLIRGFFASASTATDSNIRKAADEVLDLLEATAAANSAQPFSDARSETRAAGRWVPRMVVITTLAAVMGLTACALPRGQQPSSVPTPGITPAEIRKSLEVRPPVKPQDIKPPTFSAPRPSMPSAPSMPKIPSVHRRSEIRSGPTLVDVAVGGGITLGIFFLILAFNPFSQKSEQIAPGTGQPSIEKTVTISQQVVDEQRSQAVEAAVRAGRQGQFVTVMWATNATAEWKGARPDQLESQTGKIAFWKGRVLLTIQDGQMFSIPLTSVWNISIVGTPPSGPDRSEMRDSEDSAHQDAASFQGLIVNLLKVLKGSAVLVALAGLVGSLWDINMFAWLFPALGNMNSNVAANVLVASLSVSVALGACMIGGAIKNEQERVGREATEKALADNESMHRERAALSPVGIFETDLSGVVDYANDMALLIFGYTQEDVTKGMKVLELLVPEDRDRGQLRLREILKNGENGGLHATGEYTAVRKDGTPFPISINTRVRFKDGKPVGFRGVISDVTERKAAEKALAARKAELKASHALLSSVTEHAPGAIYRFKMSPEGHFSLPYGNANFTHAFGIAPKDLEADASGIFNSIHSEDRPKILSTIRESARTMGLWSQEFRVVLPDGTLAWRSARSRPAKLEDGGIVWTGFVTDITDRKHAEEELKESRDRLAHQDRLAAVGTLIAGVTHELNNPLAIMEGLGELLARALVQGNIVEAEGYLRTIQENVRRSHKIIQDLLLSVRAKGAPSRKSVFPLDRAIQTALDANSPALRSRQVDVFTSIDPSLVVFGDEDRIAQVFMNLIKNAVDAPNGDADKQIKITARKFLKKEGGEAMEIKVHDNGLGASSTDKWFDAYFTTKPRGLGTGLGLPLVKSFVEEAGGTIKATTAVGQGTTFEVVIPVATQAEIEASEEKTKSTVQEIVSGEVRQVHKILVVEDEEIIGKLYQRHLGDAGYEVVWAANGDKALKLLDLPAHQEQKFDLIITDYSMPVMNGAVFALAFRDRERRDDIGREKTPVVLMTGFNAGAEYEEALKLMGGGVLDRVESKNVRSESLRDLVGEMKRSHLSVVDKSILTEKEEVLAKVREGATAVVAENKSSSVEPQFVLMDSKLRHDMNNALTVFSVIPLIKISGAEREIKAAEALAEAMTRRIRSAGDITKTNDVGSIPEAASILKTLISEYQEILSLGDEVANLFRTVEDYPMTDEVRGYVRNIHAAQERFRGLIQPFLEGARQRHAAWTAPQTEAPASESASSVVSPDPVSSNVIRVLFADDEDSIRTVFSMLLTMVNNSSPWKLEIDAVESGEKALAAIQAKGVGYYDSVILDNNFNAKGEISGMEVGKKLKEEQAYQGLLILASAAKHEGAENWFSGSLLKPFAGEDLRQLILGPLVAQKERQLAAATQSRSESRSRLHTAPYGTAKDAESGEATVRSEVRLSLMVRDLVSDATVRTAAELYLMAYERDVHYTSRGISPYTGNRVSSYERQAAQEASEGLRSARTTLTEAILRRIGTWGFDQIVGHAATPMESIDVLRRSLVEPLWRATTRWPGGKQQDTVLSLMEEQNLANSLSFLRHRSEVRQTAGLWIGVRKVAVHGAWFLGGPLLVILWRFGSHGARSVLLEMIDSSSAWLKRRAANALSKDPSSLMPLIDEPGTEDRIFDAAASLVLSGDVSSKAAIIHVLIGMRHRDVRNLPRLSAILPNVWPRVPESNVDLWTHVVEMLLTIQRNELANRMDQDSVGARIALLEDSAQRLSDRTAQMNRSEVRRAIARERGRGNAIVGGSSRDVSLGESARAEVRAENLSLPVRDVVHMAFESADFFGKGGVKDVVRDKPPALLKHMGAAQTVIMPGHPSVFEEGKKAPKYRVENAGFTLTFPIEGRTETFEVYTADADGVRYYFIRKDGYFQNGYSGPNSREGLREYAIFSRAAVELLRKRFAEKKPDVIHLHDAHPALAAPFMRAAFPQEFQTSGIVMTVHNADPAYQQRFSPELFQYGKLLLMSMGMPEWAFGWQFLEFHGGLNLMKAGLVFSEKFAAVSPGYRRELLEDPDTGLRDIFRLRQNDFEGILNGLDGKLWDPATSKNVYVQYDSETAEEGKRQNKLPFQKETGLDQDEDAILVVAITRLADQKGPELILEEASLLLKRHPNVQFAIMGEENEYAKGFHDLMRKFPGRAYFTARFGEVFAQKVLAAGDFFLMPSKYEPCGLSQLQALRYGAVPIGHGVGGIDSTIIDPSEDPSRATGFKFYYPGLKKIKDLRQSPDFKKVMARFDKAVERAIWLKEEDPKAFGAMRVRGMGSVRDWDSFVPDYRKLYSAARVNAFRLNHIPILGLARSEVRGDLNASPVVHSNPVDSSTIRPAAEEIHRAEVRTADSFEVVPAEISQTKEVLALHNEKWGANNNKHMVFKEKVMRKLIQKRQVYLLRDKEDDRTVRGVLLTHPMRTGGVVEAIRKVPLWKNMMEGSVAEGPQDTVFFWGISVADSRAVPGVNAGQIFAKLAVQHFLKDFTYVRTFSPILEKEYDSFKEKLVGEGWTSDAIRKYGIYLYLASPPKEGPWTYVDHIQRDSFVTPEAFFKSTQRRYRDPAENFHVGRNGAKILGVLKQKRGFTRPDGPFTAIYGYGPGESDENFKLLRGVPLPGSTDRALGKGSGSRSRQKTMIQKIGESTFQVSVYGVGFIGLQWLRIWGGLGGERSKRMLLEWTYSPSTALRRLAADALSEDPAGLAALLEDEDLDSRTFDAAAAFILSWGMAERSDIQRIMDGMRSKDLTKVPRLASVFLNVWPRVPRSDVSYWQEVLRIRLQEEQEQLKQAGDVAWLAWRVQKKIKILEEALNLLSARAAENSPDRSEARSNPVDPSTPQPEAEEIRRAEVRLDREGFQDAVTRTIEDLKEGVLRILAAYNIKEFLESRDVSDPHRLPERRLYAADNRRIAELYNDHVEILGSVEDPNERQHDMPGFLGVLKILFETAQVVIRNLPVVVVTDGGTKSRPANEILLFGYTGLWTLVGPRFENLREVNVVNTLTMMQYLGESLMKKFIGWAASDNFIFLGEAKIGGISLGDLAHLKNRLRDASVIKGGVRVDLLSEADLRALDGIPEKNVEWTLEQVVEALGSVAWARIKKVIDAEKLTALGTVAATPDGKMIDFMEKETHLNLLVQLFYKHQKKGDHVYKNPFIEILGRHFAERLYELLKGERAVAEDMGSLDRLPVSYMQTVYQSRFMNPPRWERAWQEMKPKDQLKVPLADWMALKTAVDRVFDEETARGRGEIYVFDFGKDNQWIDLGNIDEWYRLLSSAAGDATIRRSLGIPKDVSALPGTVHGNVTAEEGSYAEYVRNEGPGQLILKTGAVASNVLLSVPEGETWVWNDGVIVKESDLRGLKKLDLGARSAKGFGVMVERVMARELKSETLTVPSDERVATVRVGQTVRLIRNILSLPFKKIVGQIVKTSADWEALVKQHPEYLGQWTYHDVQQKEFYGLSDKALGGFTPEEAQRMVDYGWLDREVRQLRTSLRSKVRKQLSDDGSRMADGVKPALVSSVILHPRSVGEAVRAEVRTLPPVIQEIDSLVIEKVARWFRAGILPLRVMLSISRERALALLARLGVHQETAVKLSDHLTSEDIRLLEEINGRSLAVSHGRTDNALAGGVVFMDVEGLMSFAKNDSLGFFNMLNEFAEERLVERPIVTAGDAGTVERIAQVLLNKNSGLTLSKAQALKLLDQVIKVQPVRGGRAATINGLAEAMRGGMVTILSSEEMLAGLHDGANFAFKDPLAKENVKLVLRTLLGRMRVLASQLDGASAVDRVKLLEEFNVRQVGGLKKISGGFVFDNILQLVQSFLAQEKATSKSA